MIAAAQINERPVGMKPNVVIRNSCQNFKFVTLAALFKEFLGFFARHFFPGKLLTLFNDLMAFRLNLF